MLELHVKNSGQSYVWLLKNVREPIPPGETVVFVVFPGVMYEFTGDSPLDLEICTDERVEIIKEQKDENTLTVSVCIPQK